MHTHMESAGKRCPGCGREVHGWLNMNSERGPKPGEPMVCDRCICIHTVDDAGNLVGFTDEQVRELDEYFRTDPAQLALLLKVVDTIRYVRAATN